MGTMSIAFLSIPHLAACSITRNSRNKEERDDFFDTVMISEIYCCHTRINRCRKREDTIFGLVKFPLIEDLIVYDQQSRIDCKT